jgi:hypothetical protein
MVENKGLRSYSSEGVGKHDESGIEHLGMLVTQVQQQCNVVCLLDCTITLSLNVFAESIRLGPNNRSHIRIGRENRVRKPGFSSKVKYYTYIPLTHHKVV